jgi:maltose alpha-D-glucosyltransferase/alpha-amylase
MSTASSASAHDANPRSGRPSRVLTGDPLWYKDAVIYEVRTRSFFDSNGDGIGDLRGLTRKLDYLADLGVTAVWLLPHYPSPGRDDGYDIADYESVHADVGTLEDFDELVVEAHRRGLRVITELVLNHTSDQHAWFQRARRAPAGSVERDFYVWNGSVDRYTEARIIFRDFEPSNWQWDPLAGAYYWHRFFAHQPDLNFENPAVHDAVLAVVDFWLARGVDGLRLDAVPYLYEEEGTNCENLPRTHAFLKKLRAHVDARFPGRMLLAEANQWPEDAARYFGDGDECQMNFHFPIMPRLFMSIHMEDRFPVIDILRQTPELHPSCQWAMFLRNHDELTLEMVTDDERDYMYRAYAHEAPMRINLGIRRRLAPLVGNDRRKMELLNGLLFSMPGTPVLYYGDEIGMGDNVYLGDRNGVRTPMQWSADRNAGFSRANPQRLILPVIIDPEYHFESLNVEAQQSNASSLLWWTKRLVAMRKRFRAFSRGSMEFLHPSNPSVLAFVRRFDEETILVVANLSRHVQYVELDLAEMKGMVPTELMGRTRFPAVGDLPYLLTLGGHDFYWFSLEPSRAAEREARMSLHGAQVLACSSVDALLDETDERAALEQVLPAFLDARGALAGPPGSVAIEERVRVPDGTPLDLVFAKVGYEDGESETLALPLAVTVGRPSLLPGQAPLAGNVVAHLTVGDADEPGTLLEVAPDVVARVMLTAAGQRLRVRGARGTLVGEPLDARGDTAELLASGDGATPRVLALDRYSAGVACGRSFVRVLTRLDEGQAPEVEVARFLAARSRPGLPLAPRMLAHVEYRAPRQEPVTLALVEELVAHEGTAWQQARGEIGRAYDRALAHPPGTMTPRVPRVPLLELARLPIADEHRELVGAYPDWAERLGRRTAELHLALASGTEPAFVPHPYGAMDQRSKYQSARNLVGRVLAQLRRALGELPPDVASKAARVVAAEQDVLGRFEPLLTTRIDAAQIRTHGDLSLGRALFTGREYVFTGIGGGRARRVSERRRKGAAMRDVAGMVRSFHWVAATALAALRPEDQARAEPWGWTWQRWAAAAYLRGYLDLAGGAVFLPKTPVTTSMLLEATLMERVFTELRGELANRSPHIWIPLQGILRMLRLELPPT